MAATPERPAARSRTPAVILWIVARLPGFAIGMAGLAKFYASSRWDRLFVSWGYPTWFSKVTGVIEIAGAVMLFVPITSMYGAVVLAATMLGALLTLLAHPGGRFGWGSTPLTYLVWLCVLMIVRWQKTRASHQRLTSTPADSGQRGGQPARGDTPRAGV